MESSRASAGWGFGFGFRDSQVDDRPFRGSTQESGSSFRRDQESRGPSHEVQGSGGESGVSVSGESTTLSEGGFSSRGSGSRTPSEASPTPGGGSSSGWSFVELDLPLKGLYLD